MPADAGPQLIDGDHVVQFYADDHELVSMVAGYLSASLAGGDAVIVIATDDHRAAFEEALDRSDVRVARREGRLVLLDAAEVLSKVLADDVPDAQAFDEVVGGVIRAAAARGVPIRAYGEMVALLWEAGLVTAAIELERLWNGLGDRTPLALFCAYPASLVSDPMAGDDLSTVCHLHSEVVTGAPALPECEVSLRFPRTPRSSLRARRFVADTLASWDRPGLVDDAVLAVAELAANAMVHAASDFTVGLSRTGGGILLEVADRSHAIPTRRLAGPTALGGRGLILVDELGRRWGHRLVDGGKVVWVELGPQRPVTTNGQEPGPRQ